MDDVSLEASEQYVEHSEFADDTVSSEDDPAVEESAEKNHMAAAKSTGKPACKSSPSPSPPPPNSTAPHARRAKERAQDAQSSTFCADYKQVTDCHCDVCTESSKDVSWPSGSQFQTGCAHRGYPKRLSPLHLPRMQRTYREFLGRHSRVSAR